MDTMANGDSDLPDTVLGAGVGTRVSRGVHGAIKRGDVPTTGDCQGGNTSRRVFESPPHPAETPDAFPVKPQLSVLFCGDFGGVRRRHRAVWLCLAVTDTAPLAACQSSLQELLWSLHLGLLFLFLTELAC